jgi:tRNA nucleotidyltransferase (CCA-adding enzyme)
VAGDGSVLELKELAIDGRDLIELGFCPGPQLGELLEICLDLVLQSPEKNTKDVLLATIKKRIG